MKNLILTVVLAFFCLSITAQGVIDYKNVFPKAKNVFSIAQLNKELIHECNDTTSITFKKWMPIPSSTDPKLIKDIHNSRMKEFDLNVDHIKSSLDSLALNYISEIASNAVMSNHVLSKLSDVKSNANSILKHIGTLEAKKIVMQKSLDDVYRNINSIGLLRYSKQFVGDTASVLLKNYLGMYCNEVNAFKSIKISNQKLAIEIQKVFSISVQEKEKTSLVLQPEKVIPEDSLLPALSVKGVVRIDSNWTNEVGYYNGNSSLNNLSNYQDLFIPESSKHTIAIKGLNIFTSGKNKLGVTYGFNYLNKDISFMSDQDSIFKNVDLFHFKVGTEFTIFKELLSVYINGNMVLPINFVNDFKSVLGFEKNYSLHMDGGLKIYLNSLSSEDKNSKLFFNLNLLRLPSIIRSLEPTENEMLDATFKVSFTKSLSKDSSN